MKIVIFSNSSWNLINFRKSLIEFLKKKYQVYLVCKKSKYYSQLETKYKKNLYLIEDLNNNFLFSFFIQLFNFIKVVKKISPNVVLSFTHKPNIINILVKFFFKYRSITVVTGLGSLFIKKKKYYLLSIIIKSFYKYANLIIFQNNSDKNFLNLKNSKIIEGSGVDLKKFKKKKQFNKKKINFYLISRIIKDKGIYEYFGAAKRLKNKNFNFFFVGDFSDENPSRLTKDRFKKLKFQSNVTCYKYKNNVNFYLNKADCVILPSYREGFSKIILESMAKGLPILGSKVPGVKDLVFNNLNGILFEPKNEDSLIEAILKFSNFSYLKRIKLGNESFKLVKKFYCDEIILKKYLKIINQKN